MKSEEALHLAARIMELRSEVSRLKDSERELRRLEQQWAALLGEDSASVARQHGSMIQVILSVLESANGEALDAEQIVERGLQGANLTSVRSALSRLYQMKKIDRGDRGKYHIRRALFRHQNEEVGTEAA